MNVYDWSCRKLVNLDPAGIFHWLLRATVPGERNDFRFVAFAPELTPSPSGERVNDLAAFLTEEISGGTPWAVALEFQSRPDPRMAGRLLEYVVLRHLMERPTPLPGDRYEVGAVVVSLRGAPVIRIEMRIPGTPGKTVFEPIHWALERCEAEEFLKPVAAGGALEPALAWLPLTRGGNTADAVAAWRARVGAIEDQATRSAVVNLVQVFAGLAGTTTQWKGVQDMILTETNEIFDELVEARLQYLLKRELSKEMSKELPIAVERELSKELPIAVERELSKELPIAVERELSKEVEKVRAEVAQEVRAEAQVEAVLRVLGRRFGAVPAEVEVAVRAIPDADRLANLLEEAAVAPDVETFGRILSAG